MAPSERLARSSSSQGASFFFTAPEAGQRSTLKPVQWGFAAFRGPESLGGWGAGHSKRTVRESTKTRPEPLTPPPRPPSPFIQRTTEVERSPRRDRASLSSCKTLKDFELFVRRSTRWRSWGAGGPTSGKLGCRCRPGRGGVPASSRGLLRRGALGSGFPSRGSGGLRPPRQEESAVSQYSCHRPRWSFRCRSPAASPHPARRWGAGQPPLCLEVPAAGLCPRRAG